MEMQSQFFLYYLLVYLFIHHIFLHLFSTLSGEAGICSEDTERQAGRGDQTQ